MFNRLFRKNTGAKLSQEELDIGRKAREHIINDAQAMIRLSGSPDFKRFCELLEEDKEELNKVLLNEELGSIRTNEEKTRLIARINQIDRVLKKPQSLIWQMKNMTEVREVIEEQTRERQALGNKTGG